MGLCGMCTRESQGQHHSPVTVSQVGFKPLRRPTCRTVTHLACRRPSLLCGSGMQPSPSLPGLHATAAGGLPVPVNVRPLHGTYSSGCTQAAKQEVCRLAPKPHLAVVAVLLRRRHHRRRCALQTSPLLLLLGLQGHRTVTPCSERDKDYGRLATSLYVQSTKYRPSTCKAHTP